MSIIKLPTCNEAKIPWCAELGKDTSRKFGVGRKFAKGFFRDADPESGQPAMIHYVVEPGKIYELKYRDQATRKIVRKCVRVGAGDRLQDLDYNAAMAEFEQPAPKTPAR